MAITDSFTGTNGTGLPTYSANWTYTRGSSADLQIQSNACGSASSSANNACERTEAAFPAAHYAQGTFTIVDSQHSMGVAVRCQGSASGNFYAFYSNNGAAELFENAGAGFTILGSNGAAFVATDVIRLTVSGTTLTPAKNGSTLSPPGAQTDATYVNGKPGLSTYNSSSTTNITRLDSFECTDASAAVFDITRNLPAFVAKGTFSGAAAAPTPGMPVFNAGDLLVIAIESANEAIATPTGYTQFVNSPQFTGTAAAAGGVRLGAFYRVAIAGDTAPTIADSGNHTCAQIYSFRGVDTGSPVNITAGTTQAATVAIIWPGVTTTVNNALILNILANDNDAASTANVSLHTNLDLTSITEQHDQTVTAGVGGGLCLVTGIKATAGSVSGTTATNAAAVTNASLTIALQGSPKIPDWTMTQKFTPLRM